MSGWYTLSSGNQTAVIGTEHTLTSTNRPGRYRLWVDFNNALASDTIEIRHKTRLQSGDTLQAALPAYSFLGGQILNPNVEFPELVVMHDLTATLKQTQGTGRAFKWELLREVSWKTGRVVADAGNSNTSFKTNLVETVDNCWAKSLCLFVGGALENQVQKIDAFNATTKTITVTSGYTSAPSAGDPFVLVDY